MKNKTLFAILLVMAISISATGALAQEMFPMMVYGEVDINGAISQGRPVEITDVNLDHTWTVYTNSKGMFSATLNNYKDDIGRYISSGHTLNIDVCNPDIDASCRKTVQASTTPTQLDFNVEVSKEAVPEIKCPACVCETCDVCDEQEVNLWTILYGVLSALGLMGVGIGVKAYKTSKGTTIQHKHPGIRGYHDPETSHRKVNIRHNKGVLTPKYKKVNGVWTYVK